MKKKAVTPKEAKDRAIEKVVVKIEKLAKKEGEGLTRLACLRYHRRETAKLTLKREIASKETELAGLRNKAKK